jgi:hypothetical protein
MEAFALFVCGMLLVGVLHSQGVLAQWASSLVNIAGSYIGSYTSCKSKVAVFGFSGSSSLDGLHLLLCGLMFICMIVCGDSAESEIAALEVPNLCWPISEGSSNISRLNDDHRTHTS